MPRCLSLLYLGTALPALAVHRKGQSPDVSQRTPAPEPSFRRPPGGRRSSGQPVRCERSQSLTAGLIAMRPPISNAVLCLVKRSPKPSSATPRVPGTEPPDNGLNTPRTTGPKARFCLSGRTGQTGEGDGPPVMSGSG